MAEINTCHDLAPSGSLLHPGSNDSVVKGSPPPRDWSHSRVWHSQHMSGRVTHLPQGSLHTLAWDENPEPVN